MTPGFHIELYRPLKKPEKKQLICENKNMDDFFGKELPFIPRISIKELENKNRGQMKHMSAAAREVVKTSAKSPRPD